MRAKIPIAAPSPTLLKFLKSQSEGLCFFSANPRAFVFDHAAPKACLPRLRDTNATSNGIQKKLAIRHMSTTAKRCATVEAGFLNLDFLWPKVQKRSRFVNGQRSGLQSIPKVDGSYVSQRYNSSGPRSWFSWLFFRNQRQRQRPLKPNDLPLGRRGEDGAESIFSLGRSMYAKAANEPKLRCTEFDENGNVVLVNGEFKKSELIAKVVPSSPTLLSAKNSIDRLNFSMAFFLAISAKSTPLFSRTSSCGLPQSLSTSFTCAAS
jgi:magnesium transporter